MHEALARAFPTGLRSIVMEVVDSLPPARLYPAGSVTLSNSRSWPDLVVAGETVTIPSRIYNAEPPPEYAASLSPQRAVVLACIYSRHHDGHVRQRSIPIMLSSDEPWVVPFVVQMLGEYVIEICADIERFTFTVLPRRPAMRRTFSAFLATNASFARLTEQRATSYWSCYYRRQHPSRDTYPGLVTLHALQRNACITRTDCGM